MKHPILTLFTLHFSLFTSLFASPFAPDPATEVVVYSSEKSASPLHVSTISTNPLDSAVSRTFPSSYTGHRSVCPIPRSTTNDCFCAWSGGISYTPGDPFGVSCGRDYPVIELTRHSPITPRIDLWTGESDRPGVAHDWTDVLATGDTTRINVVLREIDFIPAATAGIGPHPKELKFVRKKKSFICESDFLNDDEFDIAWDFLYEAGVNYFGAQMKGCEFTNVVFSAVVGDTNGQNSVFTDAIGTPIVRRYEYERRIPVPVRSVSSENSTRFVFRIENESPWASEFGSTYTAFKIKVLDGSSETWTSGLKVIPPITNGEYRYDIERGGFDGKRWRVALYNSKFKTDTIMSVNEDGIATGDPFSPAQTIISE